MKETVIKILQTKLEDVIERVDWENRKIEEMIKSKLNSENQEKESRIELEKVQGAISNLKFDELVIRILKQKEEVLIQDIKFKKNDKNYNKRKINEYEENIKNMNLKKEIIEKTIEGLKKENE